MTDIQVPSEMSIDNDLDEKTENVHLMTPDESDPELTANNDDAPSLRADDFAAVSKELFPILPDLDTLGETHFTWDIDGWRLLSKKERSPTFTCAGFPWRVLFFPHGNNVDAVSFYLEHGWGDEKPADDWYACAQFLLVLWNPNDPRIYISHYATHRFTYDEGDWGFTRFAELRKLFGVPWERFDRPMIEKDFAKVTAYVRIVKDPTGVLWHSFLNYDSKKETSMVGLRNQGATCYLNSLLQSLYFTTAFRKAVYQIPADVNEPPKQNSSYALQRLFLQLQTSDNAVSTTELTASFGWDSRHVFEQQDVQELSRILMEKLEEKMKGTEAEKALVNAFAGKMKTYIDCINVDYQSSRIEDYWDLQLNVSQVSDLDESFKTYCLPEIMDGDNKYQAEGFGLQDAKKGVIFESFPSVLHLQLKRFEYDFQRDVMMKINDRFEFPETWDASPYLSDDADRSEPYIYKLHGVLVHSGDLHAGHYFAFIKPHKDGDFFKFDDERVTKSTLREAIDDNFGGEYPLSNGLGLAKGSSQKPQKRNTNAYMLVYIRECHADKILLPAEKVEPPLQVANKYAEERALIEKKKKERDEAHLYTEILVSTNKNFQHWQGLDIVPPLSRHELTDEKAYPRTYRVKKKDKIDDLMSVVAADLKTRRDLIRPWSMVGRQNGTIRPDSLITNKDLTVDECWGKYQHKQVLKLWIEELDEDEKGDPILGEDKVNLASPKDKPLLLFLKYFDVDKQTLYGIGNFYASTSDKVADLAPQILKLLGWSSGTNYKIFEEIKAGMIDHMKAKSTLSQAEIQDGDIVTVQRVTNDKEAIPSPEKHLDVREYYEWLANRIKISFFPKTEDNQNKGIFELVLNKKFTYNQLSAKVGDRLDVDPTHLRFSPVSATNNRPKLPLKHTTTYQLGQILSSYGTYVSPTHRSDALYYEVLECSMAELEMRKFLKITYLPDGANKEEHYELLVPKNGTVSDVIDQLKRKASIPDDVATRIRLFEVLNNKIHRDCSITYPVMNFTEFTSLCAEPRSEDELDPADDERLVAAFNFERELSKSWGTPFVLLVKEGELFSKTKERVMERLKTTPKAFEKIKFAVVPRSGYGKPVYLSDEDILWEKMAADDLLGLDHPNKNRSAWARTDQIFIK